jgi:Ca2+-binding EF-hand superfamily protein
LKTIAELGGETEKGKRLIKIDEFYPLFKKAKDSKDTGGFHDFVEILKLYDKNEDSTILENELFRLLTNLGKTSQASKPHRIGNVIRVFHLKLIISA